MINKKLAAIGTALAIAATTGSIFAGGGWAQNADGLWWYGTNTSFSNRCYGGWFWVDGDKDGIAECYYFDADGYILQGTTTPDGYQVNSDGAWVVNDVVQTKEVTKGYVSLFAVGSEEEKKAAEAAAKAVTDASTIAKITCNQEVDALCTQAYNADKVVGTFVSNKKRVGAADIGGSGDMYEASFNGATAYIKEYPDENGKGNSFLVGPAKAFFNNIPEQGILMKAFYNSYGRRGVSSQSAVQQTFSIQGIRFYPIATPGGDVYTLETSFKNACVHILLTRGDNWTYYVYPDSPTYIQLYAELPDMDKFR